MPKIARPLLVSWLSALAVVGCGSSGSAPDGASGSGGAAGIHMTGSGGGSGSTGGAGQDGGGDVGEAAGESPPLPGCTSTAMDSPAMTPTTFCQIFLPICGATQPGYGSMAECVATYGAHASSTTMLQECQSYHLCTANGFSGDNRINHCVHAAAGPANMVCY
jgi:hypothetical protein